MSYYQPLFCKSEDDDVPMILDERCRKIVGYPEIEEHQIAIFERLLKEAKERTIKQNGVDDFYSNNYLANSSNLVFQEDFEYETDEEEEDDELLPTYEPEFTINWDWEDSDDDELEVISIMPNSKVVGFSVELSTMNEEIEKEVESNENKLEESYENIHDNEHAGVLEDQILPTLGLDEELHVLLGMDDAQLDDLRREHGMMTEDELLASMSLNLDEAQPLDEEFVIVVEDDFGESLLDSGLNGIVCERESVLVEEWRPPNILKVNSFGYGFFGKTAYNGIEQVLSPDFVVKSFKESNDSLLSLHPKEPPDPFCVDSRVVLKLKEVKWMALSLSLDVSCDEVSRIYWGIIRLIKKSPKEECIVEVFIGTFIWKKCYRNDKTYDNFLLCEYDSKGGGSSIEVST